MFWAGPATFAVTAIVLPTGALISGSMQGTITFSPVKLSNVAIVIGLIVVLACFLIQSWPMRVALICLALIGLPALLTLTYDRSPR